MIRQSHSTVLQSLSSEDLLELLGSDDPLMVELAAEILRDHPDVAAGRERLLGLLLKRIRTLQAPLCSFLTAKLGSVM